MRTIKAVLLGIGVLFLTACPPEKPCDPFAPVRSAPVQMPEPSTWALLAITLLGIVILEFYLNKRDKR